jgi:hypothetical protein
MRRPLPEHALELFKVRVHNHQVDFPTIDRTKRGRHGLLDSLFTDEACVCVATLEVVRISFTPVDQTRARGEKL